MSNLAAHVGLEQVKDHLDLTDESLALIYSWRDSFSREIKQEWAVALKDKQALACAWASTRAQGEPRPTLMIAWSSASGRPRLLQVADDDLEWVKASLTKSDEVAQRLIGQLKADVAELMTDINHSRELLDELAARLERLRSL